MPAKSHEHGTRTRKSPEAPLGAWFRLLGASFRLHGDRADASAPVTLRRESSNPLFYNEKLQVGSITGRIRLRSSRARLPTG